MHKVNRRIGQRNVVEIKEKGLTRRRVDRGKEYTMRHRFHYVNHAARKLLATEFVPEDARPTLNEKGDPRSRTWGPNSCDTTRGVSTRNHRVESRERDPNVSGSKPYQQG